jgi:hypothetical protein
MRLRASLLFLLVLPACSDDSRATRSPDGTGGDATADTGGSGADTSDDDALADTAGDDTTPPDTGADSSVPDGSGDTSGDDVTADTATDTGGEGDTGADSNEDADTGAGELSASTFAAALAASVCGRLSDCCNAESQERFFAACAASSGVEGDPYAAFQSRIPPVGPPLDEAGCVDLLGGLYGAGPFGSWAGAVAAGRAGFDADAARSCVEGIDRATCGAELLGALGPSGCASVLPPEPGTQRSMFVRTAQSGTCQPVRDGFGGLYYGTCDPQTSFCCNLEGGRCVVPTLGSEGQCVVASGVGSDCSYFGDLQLCTTGLDCDTETGLCGSLDYPRVGLGNRCWDDAAGDFVGECFETWCDWFGTGNCELRKRDGESCLVADECESLRCESGSCAAEDFCEAP